MLAVPFSGGGFTKLVTGMELPETGTDGDTKYISLSTQGSGAKRRVWEASLSSLKSKKVKGTHLVGCQTEPNLDVDSESDGYDSCRQRCPLDITKNKSLFGCPPIDPLASSRKEKNAQSCGLGNLPSEALIRGDFSSQRQCFKVMLMNIADDTKKAHLTKVYIYLFVISYIKIGHIRTLPRHSHISRIEFHLLMVHPFSKK